MAAALVLSCWFQVFYFYLFLFSYFQVFVETVGVERVVAEELCCLVVLATDEGWIELTTPSIGVSVGGLARSILGQET